MIILGFGLGFPTPLNSTYWDKVLLPTVLVACLSSYQPSHHALLHVTSEGSCLPGFPPNGIINLVHHLYGQLQIMVGSIFRYRYICPPNPSKMRIVKRETQALGLNVLPAP